MASYPATMPMRVARDLYLNANGFSTAEYGARSVTIGFLGMRVKFPNTAARKRAIPFHDLHHVLTGYGTDWIGEGEIGAWELRAGCNSLILYVLNGGGVVIAMFLSPRRVWRAFRAARNQRTLYRSSASYESLLPMSVGEIRRRQGIPEDGIAGVRKQ